MNPLTGVLGEAWALYRRFARHLIFISFAIYLVVAVISALLSWGLGSFGALLSLIVSLIGMYLLQAALVKAGSTSTCGPPCGRRRPLSARLPSPRSWPASASRSGSS
jgi:uncharacterized membrane protein